VRRLETGYFQPEYLAKFGFRTDPTSGGLVRDVEPGAAPERGATATRMELM
jgi:hypothetical protein